jgi:hypothetical protein
LPRYMFSRQPCGFPVQRYKKSIRINLSDIRYRSAGSKSLENNKKRLKCFHLSRHVWYRDISDALNSRFFRRW